MRPWIKILIGVVIGFGAGFGSGFFFHKKLNEVEFEEISEEEMAAIEEEEANKKNYIPEKVEDKEEAAVEKVAELVDKTDGSVDELRNALQGKVSYAKADNEAKAKYASMWSVVQRYSNEENADNLPIPIDEDENLDEEFLEEMEEEEVEPGQVDPPHVISFSEFYNDRPEYDKVTIDWYEEDNTWVDDHEEIIADIFSYIGFSPEKEFDKPSNEDPDILFTRYEEISTDFELIRHHNSYAEMMGLNNKETED